MPENVPAWGWILGAAAAIGTAVGAFVTTVWRGFRAGHAAVPLSISPASVADDTLRPQPASVVHGEMVATRETPGRRLEDAFRELASVREELERINAAVDERREEFRDHLKEAEPMMRDWNMVKSRIDALEKKSDADKREVLAAVADGTRSLHDRLGGIERALMGRATRP